MLADHTGYVTGCIRLGANACIEYSCLKQRGHKISKLTERHERRQTTILGGLTEDLESDDGRTVKEVLQAEKEKSHTTTDNQNDPPPPN